MSRRLRKGLELHRAAPHRSRLIAGLSVFIAFDVVIVALALGWGRAEPIGEAFDLETPTQSQAIANADRSHVHTPTPSPDIDIAQTVPSHLIAASETVAWRSEVARETSAGGWN